MADTPSICIGGASGFWGDAALATPQLLRHPGLDFLVYDYLAEITLSIMARARAADPSKGYATDFVSAAMAPNLHTLAERGVRVISNAGGVNPLACAEALRGRIQAQGLTLRVAVIEGDDLVQRAGEFAQRREMFSGEAFPPVEQVASINAYVGAAPIARALDAGADIVIVGRCVDSAVTLGACLHAFGWAADDYARLAQGSLAGHILECGTQATGGNFTDWEQVAEHLPEAGYPVAEIAADGHVVIGKPAATGGTVSVGSVGEQMLYEIGDPSAYVLPDVVCDFTRVRLQQLGQDRVGVSGARGRGAPASYTVCATWADGYRAGQIWTMIGRDAPRKARLFADAVIERTARALQASDLAPLAETSVEILGVESHYGRRDRRPASREVDVKIAVKHAAARGVAVFLKEMVGLALTAPPGLAGFAGARPKPMPVVRLFSFLLPKDAVPLRLELDRQALDFTLPAAPDSAARTAPAAVPDAIPAPTVEADAAAARVPVSLEALAYARSGDKGDKVNIGIMARDPAFLPWIARHLTAARVRERFAHFLAGDDSGAVQRFYLPGVHALNFLLHDVLGGGGVASLRADPQGKAYAQVLLAEAVPVPRELAQRCALPVLDTLPDTVPDTSPDTVLDTLPDTPLDTLPDTAPE